MQIAARILAAACAALVVGGGVARANLITNGGFEAPIVAAGSFSNFGTGSTGITGWTVTGPAGKGVSPVSTTFVQNGVTFEAQAGNQWLDMTGDGSNSTEGVQQSVATTAGTNYVLTFYVGNTTGGGIFGTTSTDGLDINGVRVGTFTNNAADATGLNWEQFSYSFMASGASTTIGFVNLDPGSDNSNGLDGVDLELGTVGAPEPASIGLAGCSLVALALLVRRRRRAK